MCNGVLSCILASYVVPHVVTSPHRSRPLRALVSSPTTTGMYVCVCRHISYHSHVITALTACMDASYAVSPQHVLMHVAGTNGPYLWPPVCFHTHDCCIRIHFDACHIHTLIHAESEHLLDSAAQPHGDGCLSVCDCITAVTGHGRHLRLPSDPACRPGLVTCDVM